MVWVSDLVAQFVELDVGSLDRGAAESALARSAAVRRWLDAFDVRITSRLREMSKDAPGGMPVPDRVAALTRRGVGHGRRLVQRAKTTDRFPELASGRDGVDGGVSGEHLDVIHQVLSRLPADARDRFRTRFHGHIVAAARAGTPEELRDHLLRWVREFGESDGTDRLAQQRRQVGLRSWWDRVTGMLRFTGQYDPEAGWVFTNRIQSTLDALFHERLPEQCPDDPEAKVEFLRALALLALTGQPVSFAGRGGRASGDDGAATAGASGDDAPRAGGTDDGDAADVGASGAGASGAGASGGDASGAGASGGDVSDVGAFEGDVFDVNAAAGKGGEPEGAGADGEDADHPIDGAEVGEEDGGRITGGAERVAGRPPAGRQPGGRVTARATDRCTCGGRGQVVRWRTEAVVVIDERTLGEGWHPHSHVDLGVDGLELPLDTIRRIVTTSSIIPVYRDANGVVVQVGDGRLPLDLGRRTRVPNRAQYLALRAMYPTCGVSGCRVPFQRCQIHHVIWWRNGGRTDLRNLLPICSRHHHLVHDEGWVLHLARDRTLTISLPDGTFITSRPPPRWPP